MTNIKFPRSPEEQARLDREYGYLFEREVWASCKDVVRTPRPFSTKDFEREYFIPDL